MRDVINPSSVGWIGKFFRGQTDAQELPPSDALSFYKEVRATGFIYGHIISLHTKKNIPTQGWLDDEMSKLALLILLYRVFQHVQQSNDPEVFLTQTVAFYKQMNPKGSGLFDKILPGNSLSVNLEEMIAQRVQTNENIISRNFSHIVTNALLFIDVLAYLKYLQNGAIPEKYLKRTEELIIGIVALALQSKTRKSQYDDLLIRLFEASVRYTKFSESSLQQPESLLLSHLSNPLEKYYLLDMAALAMWSDGLIENQEADFLHAMGQNLGVCDDFVSESIQDLDRFIGQYKKEIPYFNYSNPVKHFYDHMTETVLVLIRRNKKRLVREIMQSGELMKLLAVSTTRDLDEIEKKKVRKQLLDICKSVPSLTIFLLPGGSLLLPILIKFIPQLLPSAFNENSDNE